MLIYKILLPEEWAEFEAAGRFDGSPFDRSSGFVHCSSERQVAATARRVFATDQSLVVVGLDTGPLGEALRWERAPEGDVYPHVYGSLPRRAVVTVDRVPGPSSVGELLPPTP